ncbi:MAG: peroxiredoxin-like family protein [Olleya sp.]
MKTLKEQTDAKIESGRKNNPEFNLPDPKGDQTSLSNLLNQGPVVVTFYRGSWCPYCNLQLRALQARVKDIHALGATLVAISPEVPDGSLTENDINNMDFIVLSDQDAKVASSYGVAWKVPDFLMDHMRVDRNLDLKQINNGNGSVLPIPATFIIGQDGLVKWNYVNVDYRTRSEPEEITEALKKLS